MSSSTMVFGAVTRRSEKWRVYRIRTANSVYELEVQTEPASAGARRCSVLTLVEPAARAGASFEDSTPQVGGESLYALSPMEWIGKSLSVGTARTTPVVSVDFVATTAAPRRSTSMLGVPASAPAFTSPRASAAPAPAPAPPAEAAPRWAPFPLGQIEMVEAAASVLKAVCHQHQMPAAIEHDAHLMKRFRLALAECGLMLEAMERRGSRG